MNVLIAHRVLITLQQIKALASFAKTEDLGVLPSYTRPRISDNKPYQKHCLEL